MDKIVTVGIPAYHAQSHICDLLASIQIQTIVNMVQVIIASDDTSDNYEFVRDRFPTLDIIILSCEKNTGPGLARQRALDACTTPWITFCDADDVLINPVALERLLQGTVQNCVVVQGAFYQECKLPDGSTQFAPRNDAEHPWVFGRLYNVQFLRENNIRFSSLKAMEDAELNWCVRLTIEGSPLVINIINEPIYMWRIGSEHSITRIGIDEQGIPQYNFDACQVGATVAAIRAINFCHKSNPFNGSILRFTTEMMVGQYFTYVECLERKPVFAEQNLFNAKRFYHECYKNIEHQIDENVLKNIYTLQMASRSRDLIGIIPAISFYDFMSKVKNDPYGGHEEFESIRSRLPQEILDNDAKSGVFSGESSH